MASTLLSRVMGGAPPPKEAVAKELVKELLEQMQHVLRRAEAAEKALAAEEKKLRTSEKQREKARREAERAMRVLREEHADDLAQLQAAHEHLLAQRDAWHHHELAQAEAHAAARRQAEREAEEWERKAEAARAAAKAEALREARVGRGEAAARRRVGRLKLARAWAQWRERWHGVTWRRRAVAGLMKHVTTCLVVASGGSSATSALRKPTFTPQLASRSLPAGVSWGLLLGMFSVPFTMNGASRAVTASIAAFSAAQRASGKALPQPKDCQPDCAFQNFAYGLRQPSHGLLAAMHFVAAAARAASAPCSPLWSSLPAE